MLRKCPECAVLFLISDNAGICNSCAEYLRRRIEQLHETDNAESWITVMSRAIHGEQPERAARWRIG